MNIYFILNKMKGVQVLVSITGKQLWNFTFHGSWKDKRSWQTGL